MKDQQDGKRPVLAVDPGRGKCGLAVVYREGRVAEQSVVPRDKLREAVTAAAATYALAALVVGDRTGSRDCVREMRALVSCPVVMVQEHETTLRARERYFRENPPRGLWRLMPLGLLSPPRPVDDYAAVLLAERYWAGERTR